MDTTNNTGEWFDACDEYTATPARKAPRAFKVTRVTPTFIYVSGTTQDDWKLMA